MEAWLADNYRTLVDEGRSSWAAIAEQFRAAGDEPSAAWADAQAVEVAAVAAPENAARKPAAPRKPAKD